MKGMETMSGLLENVQPAVKKETKRVVMITGAGLILMWILFAILHYTMPDKVPFDYTVILGGIGGGVIAVLNFFLMGLAVQKAASATDEGTAQSQLFAAFYDDDSVGDRCNRCSVFSICSGNCSTSVSGNGTEICGDIS